MKTGSKSITRRRFLAATAAWAASTTASRATAAEVSPFKPKRVVLVTLDTLRRDHLSFHGYPRNTTPFLSRIAPRSVVFNEAICGCSNTTPAHMSLLSSLHLPQHHMYYNAHESVPRGLYFMADMFRGLGFETAGFASVIWMRLFAQGFDTYRSYAERYVQPGSERVFYQPAETTVTQALEWLEGHSVSDRFFLWIHLYDAHDPYYPPAELANAVEDDYARRKEVLFRHWTLGQHKLLGTRAFAYDRGVFVRTQNLYDAEIRYTDRELARLYDAMTRMGLNDDSLWVVTSDHGEGLGARGYMGHGMEIYQEQVSCPLLMHTPGGQFPGQAHPARVHHVDLLPTLAEMYGASLAAQPMAIQGHSLLAALRQPGISLPPRDLYCQRRLRVKDTKSNDWPKDPVFGLHRGPYMYLHRTDAEDALFHLGEDPYQQRNLIHADVPGKDDMLRAAKEKFAELTEDGRAIEGTEFTDQYTETLEALGYL